MLKSIRLFLFITFSIMLACWGICLICSILGLYISKIPLLYIPYLLGGLSPTIASYMVWKQHGSFKGWLSTVFDFRQRLCAYCIPLFYAVLFFFCLCVVSGYTPGAPMFSLIWLLPLMLLCGGLEEVGWRGLLFPELCNKYGYIASTLITALIWWVWHFPLFYIKGVSQYGGDFLAFGLNVIGLSFALSSIKRLTGSTWLCILFHCLINSLHGIFIITESKTGSLAASSAMILASCILLNMQKRKIFFRKITK